MNTGLFAFCKAVSILLTSVGLSHVEPDHSHEGSGQVTLALSSCTLQLYVVAEPIRSQKSVNCT